MLRSVGKTVEPLGHYEVPQKVVFTVRTAGNKIYVGTQRYQLGATINGNLVGTQIADTDGPIALDLLGTVYWVGTADPTYTDVLEAGAL